jgi:ABC-type phosphate transport system substrate-binding protein
MLSCSSCGSPLLLEGKYLVVKMLSRKGGLVDTYEVTQQQQFKVLKVLKSDDVKVIELFEREFRVLRRLNYLGIPQVEEIFLYQPRSFYQPLHCVVLEKIEGIDLEWYFKGLVDPINQKTAVNWLSQLTGILQKLHEKEIYHRIQPSNIILQPDGQLALIDFGAVNQAASNQDGIRVHTPDYNAPEQEEASAPADFFALGRTLAHLLTGKEPNDLYDSRNGQFIWKDKTKDISPQLLDLLEQMMHQDPSMRPPNAGAILQKITAWQILEPTANNVSHEPLSTFATKLSTFATNGLPDESGELFAASTTNGLSDELFSTSTINGSSDGAVETVIQIPAAKVPRKLSRLYWLGIMPLLGLAVFAGYSWKDSIKSVISTTKGQYFSGVNDVPNGQFRFGGSTSWATTRQSQSFLDASIQGAFPQFKLVYTNPDPAKTRSIATGKCSGKHGSNTGICMLIEGDLDFVQSSVSLAKSKYADRVTEHRLKEIPVAYDALTIVVNTELKVSGLTMAQLRDIYSGTLTNWNQVGGPDLPIKPFSLDPNASGTVSSFQDLVLGKEGKFNFDVVQTVQTPNAGLQETKSDPSAIFYGSAKEMIVDFCDSKPLLIGQDDRNLVEPFKAPLRSPYECFHGERNQINVNNIKTQKYPLTRKIYIIFKADSSNSQKAGESYARLLTTNQGQELLEKAGFVSISK